MDGAGGPVRDVVGLVGEAGPAAGAPILARVVRGGVREHPPRAVDEVRKVCQRAVARLPAEVRRRRDAAAYPVTLSPGLERLAAGLAAELSVRGAS